MKHIREIVDPGERPRHPYESPHAGISWSYAAEEALAVARARRRDPATSKQLRRVCQLLTSRTVQENERRRAFFRLAHGCTRREASAMLDYLIPAVRTRSGSAQLPAPTDASPQILARGHSK